MTLEEHRQEHVRLNTALDTLVADWLAHHPNQLLAKHSIIELMRWSYLQTKNPSIVPNEHANKSGS